MKFVNRRSRIAIHAQPHKIDRNEYSGRSTQILVVLYRVWGNPPPRVLIWEDLEMNDTGTVSAAMACKLSAWWLRSRDFMTSGNEWLWNIYNWKIMFMGEPMGLCMLPVLQHYTSLGRKPDKGRWEPVWILLAYELNPNAYNLEEGGN